MLVIGPWQVLNRRADIESAPTAPPQLLRRGRFYIGPYLHPLCRGDHWSPANFALRYLYGKAIAVQAATGEQCSPLQVAFSTVSGQNKCPEAIAIAPGQKYSPTPFLPAMQSAARPAPGLFCPGAAHSSTTEILPQ